MKYKEDNTTSSKVHCQDHTVERTFSDSSDTPEPWVIADIPVLSKKGYINLEAPTAEQVKATTKDVKIGKVTGVDGVAAEILKSEEKETPRLLINPDIQ